MSSSSDQLAPVVINADGLGKRYRIGDGVPGLSLHDALRRLRKRGGSGRDASFRALQDLSFDVRRGEIVGIIGRNGAGKSTLLKLVSRITAPSEGTISGRGRIGSLLEAGTGFHPELTGRDNIYLSGSILGMKRKEIRRRFDEIVEFAGIGEFLDTPVKRYSSGMFVRLGFAVAAHLESDILLIDEVLAVGDAAFQIKCLQKIRQIATSGRTIIFVSHNMSSVRNLCTRVLWLDSGRLRADGPPADIVAHYLESLEFCADTPVGLRQDRHGSGQIRLEEIRFTGSGAGGSLEQGSACQIHLRTNDACEGLSCSFTIYDLFGQPVTFFDSASSAAEIGVGGSSCEFVCNVPELLLLPGRYRVNAAIERSGETLDHIEAAAYFDVIPSSLKQTYESEQTGYGSIYLPHRWEVPRA